MTISYKLNEQVCLQRVSLAFLANGWNEWFLNPTAGPWKKLRIEGVPKDHALLRFRKEEDRPDLLVAHPNKSIIVVFEAKEDISSLLVHEGEIVEKAIKVFEATAVKIFEIIQKFPKEMSPFSEPRFLSGYIFPVTPSYSSTSTNLLNEYHKTKRIGRRNVGPNINTIVKRMDNDDLVIECGFPDEITKETRSLLERL